MASINIEEIVWQIVASIPKGNVVTYGQVARLAAYPNHARAVGSILRKLPSDTSLPWYRVVNAQGKLSFVENSDAYKKQQLLLESEGVKFNNMKLSLTSYRWNN